MSINTPTMASRHKVEEDLRDRAYSVIDTSMLDPNNIERLLWADVHEILCELALFYEKQGFTILKH